MSHLAHHVCDVDKYRVETCCVIGKGNLFFFQHLFVVFSCLVHLISHAILPHVSKIGHATIILDKISCKKSENLPFKCLIF